jgi:hypothetical protein
MDGVKILWYNPLIPFVKEGLLTRSTLSIGGRPVPHPRKYLLSVCSFGLMAAMPLLPAQQSPSETTPPQSAAGGGQQQYKIVVVRGENAQNRVKKGRATSLAVVEVRDENNVPVAGIAVTFTLPALGASGAFTSGGVMTTVVTGSTGQAAASFTPNAVAGTFNIGVSANVAGEPVTATIAQSNVAAAAGAGVSGTTIGVIAGVVAAAAAGGIVAATSGKKSSPGAAAPAAVAPAPSGIRIGFGAPGASITVGPR